MKTVKTFAAALLVLSLAACKKDAPVTPRQQASTNNKVNKPPAKTPVADTVIVSDHQIVAQNVRWIFPWYSALEVKNIHSYFPEGTPIRVFVQRDNSDIWKEATHALIDGNLSEYYYFIEKRQPDGAGMYHHGSLYVFYYGMDTSDTPDVKVEF